MPATPPNANPFLVFFHSEKFDGKKLTENLKKAWKNEHLPQSKRSEHNCRQLSQQSNQWGAPTRLPAVSVARRGPRVRCDSGVTSVKVEIGSSHLAFAHKIFLVRAVSRGVGDTEMRKSGPGRAITVAPTWINSASGNSAASQPFPAAETKADSRSAGDGLEGLAWTRTKST